MAVKGGLRLRKMVKVDITIASPVAVKGGLRLRKMVKVDYYHRQPGGCERWSTTKEDGKG